MRILFSTTYYYPYVSGLSLYIKRLSEALVAKKHTVDVVCIRHDAELSQEELIEGVHIVRAKPFIALSKGFLSFGFIGNAWRYVQTADVVVVNLPQFEGVWPALFARILGKKVIAIYHSEVTLPAGFVNSIIGALLEVANMATLLISEVVVTYTDDFAHHSKLLRLIPDKVETCYPPVPKPTRDPAVVKILDKKIGTADVVIGVAARLAAEKGLEYLFDAIPSIEKSLGKSVRVAIAGPDKPVGERAYRKKIRALAAQYKKQLVFLGTLTQEEMGSFYSLLEVLVLPSVNSTETFGMVQVEAMMCSVPVIASDLPGVRVPVGETGMGVIVPPKKPQAIADAVVTILKNKKQYTKPVGEITKRFALSDTVKFYLNLFTE
jgi:glycosyltransferase involved in cell wall biosynthesis